MAFGSRFHMPGAFHFDGPSSNSPPTLTGVHPGLFRPPVSPSPSNSMHLTKSTTSILSETTAPGAANAKRKRSRPSATALSVPPVHTANFDFSYKEEDVPGKKHYMLAGQLDTPNGGATRHTDAPSGVLDDSTYSDADYRRELGSKRHFDFEPRDDGPTPQLTQTLNDAPPSSQAKDGWSRFALNAIGGVVGKVWEFCKAGAFRGFYAGDGAGYDIDGNISGDPMRLDEDVNAHTDTYREFGNQMPALDYNPYIYENQSTPESTPPPAAKRRQVSDHHDDLHRNWVVVTESSASDQAAQRRQLNGKHSNGLFLQQSSAPSRAPSRASGVSVRNTRASGYSAATASSSGRRISVPVSRLGHRPGFSSSASSIGGSYRRAQSRASGASAAGSLTLNTLEPASIASQRSPNPSPIARPRSPAHSRPSTPSRIPVLSPNRFANNNPRIPSPTAPTGHRRSRSNVSSSSVRAPRKSIAEQSPRLTDEAKELAHRKLAAEREVDARMNVLNRNLQEMIRLGKEALGTRVEVEFEGDEVETGVWVDE